MGDAISGRARIVVAGGAALYARIADDVVPLVAAALAYYALLSIIPLLLFVVSALSMAITPNDLSRLVAVLALGDVGVALREQVLNYVANRTLSGGVSLLALILTLWAGSQVFLAFAQSLDRVWGVPDPHPAWLQRARALLMVIVFAVLVTLAVVALNVQGLVIARLPKGVASVVMVTVLTYLLVWAWITGLFALACVVLPAKRLHWRAVLIGAAGSAALWVAATTIFGWVAGNLVRYSAIYGTLGAAIILLIWFYISGIALLLSAEVADLMSPRLEPAA